MLRDVDVPGGMETCHARMEAATTFSSAQRLAFDLLGILVSKADINLQQYCSSPLVRAQE